MARPEPFVTRVTTHGTPVPDNRFTMCDWRQAYSALWYESDAASLVRLIHRFEELAVKRQQELARNPHPGESREIWFALRHVISIKAERLGWPDPRYSNARRQP